MSFTSDVISELRGFAGIQSLVGNDDSPETYRIYNLVMEQGAAMPAIVIERLNASKHNTMTDAGGPGLQNVRLRVKSYSDNLDQALQLADQVELAFKASANLSCVPLMAFDQYEPDTKLYVVIADFSIWYK